MKFLCTLLLLCLSTTLLSQATIQDYFSKPKNQKFEYVMVTVLKADQGKCFQPMSTTSYLAPLSLPSDVRYKMRKDKKDAIGDGKTIKADVSYKYIRKNFTLVEIEHQIKRARCEGGVLRRRELLVFAEGEYRSQASLDRKARLTAKDSIKLKKTKTVDEKVKKTTTYLWWKNDKYDGYKVIREFKPYTDDNEEGLMKRVINSVRKFMIEKYDEKERKLLYDKLGAACMCVRG